MEVLYNELDQWRDAETKRIKQAEVGERRKLALRELLHKETRLLQTIDRLKITAAQEGKVRCGGAMRCKSRLSHPTRRRKDKLEKHAYVHT